ncbi:MAG: glycosyltransferase family 4 protein, partial [Mariprofundales bacterium]
IFVYEPSPFTVGIPAILMRYIKKAPVLFWVQDLWPESLSATGAVKSPLVLSFVSKIVRWIYGRCDKVLVQSEGFIDPAIAAGAVKEDVEYFPNWAELLYCPVEVPSNSQERSEVPSEGFVVMFAGNLGAAQSLETILDAAEMLKAQNIYWIFLGDGRCSDWMRAQISARQLHRVRMLGSRPVTMMPSYFALADAMLVTLRADPIMSRTIPGKVQSYLACGRPIIGSLDGEGAKVINENHAGYAVASGDVHGLANAVARMSNITNVELREMGEAALACYNNAFDRNKLLNKLEGMMLAMKDNKQ